LFKTLVEDKVSQKEIENEKNEDFVLRFTFQCLDAEKAGFISKDEALAYLKTSRDI
jgi:hypothetical protein